MRKQGLVHLHALCTLLREHLRNREEFPADAFDCDGAPASPVAIHHPKDEHRQAVGELVTDIAEVVDAERERDRPVSGERNADCPDVGTSADEEPETADD